MPRVMQLVNCEAGICNCLPTPNLFLKLGVLNTKDAAGVSHGTDLLKFYYRLLSSAYVSFARFKF